MSRSFVSMNIILWDSSSYIEISGSYERDLEHVGIIS